MAANLVSRRVGERFVKQIRTDQIQPIALSFRRAVHESVYNKNLDENVRPIIVPDEFIPLQSDKYWAPHPKTGVFGPASEENRAAGSLSANASEESVLEQKAFFRPLEDLDKPLQ